LRIQRSDHSTWLQTLADEWDNLFPLIDDMSRMRLRLVFV
jgi:hypothetical protein